MNLEIDELIMYSEEYKDLRKQIEQEGEHSISKHVLASGDGLHCEGGSQYGTNELCRLMGESKNHYIGNWEWSIYHGLIFKKSEFQITKDNLTRTSVLDFIMTHSDYQWRKDRILEGIK